MHSGANVFLQRIYTHSDAQIHVNSGVLGCEAARRTVHIRLLTPIAGLQRGVQSAGREATRERAGCSIVQYCLLHSRLMQRQTPVKSSSLSPKLTGDSDRNSAWKISTGCLFYRLY